MAALVLLGVWAVLVGVWAWGWPRRVRRARQVLDTQGRDRIGL
jgi:hypothetical protein